MLIIIRIVYLKINKIVKHILIIGNVSNNSSSISPSVQVLRQQIGGCACADNDDVGGGVVGLKSGKLADVILEHSLILIL